MRFLFAIFLLACSKPEAPRAKTNVQIIAPKELKDWLSLEALSFPLADGSDSSPEVIILNPEESLKKLPSGELKPHLWITSNTEHASLAARDVRNLGAIPRECEPLFQSSVIVTSDEKSLHELDEPVDLTSLKGNLWIESPHSSSVFAQNLNPEKLFIYPQGTLPYSVLRSGEYIITTRIFSSGILTTNSPAIYSVCLLEHPLLDGKQASAARAVFSKIRSLSKPKGTEPVVGSGGSIRTIPGPKKNLIFLDATGSLADSGFGGLQRFALGLINKTENFSLTIASSSSRVITDKEEALSAIQSQKAQGESNSFETLRELISKNRSGLIWVLTDTSFLKEQKGLITLIENTSRFSNAYLLFYVVGEHDPVLDVINNFPGVWVFNQNEKKVWEDYFEYSINQ